MKIIVAFAFYLFYWLVCFLCTGTDKKNLIGLRSYPDAVQRAVRANPAFSKLTPAEKPLVSVLAGNLVLFTLVFSALGLALKSTLGLDGFLSSFWFFLSLGEGLGAFDLVVVDLLWWRNTPRIRFSFLPDKAAYRDPAMHLASFYRGIPLFAAVAALSAAIVAAIPGYLL